MRLTFEVNYHTRTGQDLFLTGASEILGEWDTDQAIPMEYRGAGIWQVTLVLPDSMAPQARLAYGYILRELDGSCEQDSGQARRINFHDFKGRNAYIIDTWNPPGLVQNAFLTGPFQGILLHAATGANLPDQNSGTHVFSVCAPALGADETICLLGNCAALGNWSESLAIPMSRSTDASLFSTSIDLSQAHGPVEYKYVIRRSKQEKLEYEAGANRIAKPARSAREQMILNDGFLRVPVGVWKGAGVAVPVFSLRSEGGFGIGDFGDLKLLADWAAKTGLRMIQILPVNDTITVHTWVDSYPYAAISAFALHPIYLDFRQATGARLKKRLAASEALRKELNALPNLDYERVIRAKLDLAHAWFEEMHRSVFATAQFKEFYEANRGWLGPYAVFSVLRDRYGAAEFSNWPEHQKFDPALVESMSQPTHPDHLKLAFHWFVQFQLHSQLQSAATHAHRAGVALKGDIAIGVNRHGVDTWQQPELYELGMQAGAPPDAFAAKGQNWSFPTYRWPRMQLDHFAWWRRRFEQMGRYFDAFRIDHILGFFRIWSIPCHAVEGILGYFVPALPVRPEEFAAWGIPFDYDRLVKPWINDSVLAELFGELAERARREFFIQEPDGYFKLRPDLATQRQVQAMLSRQAPDPEQDRLRQGLFDVISNVILLEAEGGRRTEFHFRIGMQDTVSFRQLPSLYRDRLYALYEDYFFRRQEPFWRQEGMRKLPALKEATEMLICGEDLGMVPDCVPMVMKHLGLLGLEVQRMPKRLGQNFSRPAEAPYLAVVTPSTHDMSPIRAWWLEDAAVTQRFYNQELGRSGAAPDECDPGIAQAIIAQHLESPAMWSVFQIQDLLALSEELRRADPKGERINIPAVTPFCWCYRLHLSLERLIAEQGFNESLRALLTRCGRAMAPS